MSWVHLRALLFQDVRKEGNKFAQALVKRAVSSTDTNIWVEELPSDLDNIFQSNLD